MEDTSYHFSNYSVSTMAIQSNNSLDTFMSEQELAPQHQDLMDSGESSVSDTSFDQAVFDEELSDNQAIDSSEYMSEDNNEEMTQDMSEDLTQEMSEEDESEEEKEEEKGGEELEQEPASKALGLDNDELTPGTTAGESNEIHGWSQYLQQPDAEMPKEENEALGELSETLQD